MSLSFFQSESGRFAGGVGALLVGAAGVQLWQTHGDWAVLLSLVPCALLLALWIRRLVPNARLLGGVRSLANEVAQGKFHRDKIHAPHQHHDQRGGQVTARQGFVFHQKRSENEND